MKSGRSQLLLRDPETGKHFGSGSFDTEAEADLQGQRAVVEQHGGTWLDPRRGEVLLSEYLTDWLTTRTATGRHGDRYGAEAARLARLHIVPQLGHRQLGELRPPVIRKWYDDLVARRIKESGRPAWSPPRATACCPPCSARRPKTRSFA